MPADEDVPIACTLDAAALPGRLRDWADVVARVVERSSIDGGVRLTLDAGVDAGRLATLAAAEQGCCAFLAFAVTIDGRGVGLEVTAPSDAGPIVDSLFG